MVHSVELLFDDETDRTIRGVWDDLSEAGIRSQAAVKSPSNRPHVTLTVASQMTDEVDEALLPVLDRLPLTCTIGAAMLFGRGPFTVVRLLVPSPSLLDLHADVHRVCLAHMPSGPLAHAAPGEWTPHVTLARRVDVAQLPQAFGLRSVSRDVTATAVGLRHWDGERRVEHHIGQSP